MHRDFEWLKGKHGDEARNILEKICLDVFVKEYPNDDVQYVKPNPGDGGIDVYVSHENDDFTIIQCKYFLGEIDSSRKGNIKKSFKKALETKGSGLTKWVLCIPEGLTLKEQLWWEEWKKTQKKEFHDKYNKKLKINLLNGDKFLSLIKQHNLYEEYFETERVDKVLVEKLIKNDEKKEINNKLYALIGTIAEGDYIERSLVTWIDQVMYLRGHRVFKESAFFNYLDQLNQLMAYHSGPKNEEYAKKNFDLRNRIIEEYKKLDL